jgi:hypothetical protein
MCELLVRLRAVGLTQDHSCQLPITQGELADATGISNVHVNRVIQELRSEGLIVVKGNMLKVPDWEKLQEVAEFDPTLPPPGGREGGRMSLTLQPVRVANVWDEDGLLVSRKGSVSSRCLTRLSDQYDGVTEEWDLEAGFFGIPGAHISRVLQESAER